MIGIGIKKSMKFDMPLNKEPETFASSLKIEQKLQISGGQFLRKNQMHVNIVVNKPYDSKNMFQSMIIKV